jgi:hypothetical protein
VINLINVIYVIKGLYRVETCRNTLEHIQVINLINVIYVARGFIAKTTCSNTLEHIQDINLINVINVIKSFIRINIFKHANINTGDKRHKCDICGKGFNRKDDIFEHMHMYRR